MSDYGTLRRHLLAVPFEIVMLGGAVVMAAKGDHLHLLTSLFTFAISFLPLAVERWLRVRLPMWLQTVYVAFVFASMFSGEVLGMYHRIWSWDDWMHFGSGLLIAVGVVLWTTYLNEHTFKVPLWLQCYLAVATAALIGVMWELAEFTSDQVFGTFSQRGDLTDTMLDLLHDVLGAVIVAVIWRLSVGRKDAVGLVKLVGRFSKLQR